VILLLLFATVGFAYEGGPVEGGATIQGTVRFNGPADKPSPHQVFKHQEVCGKAVEDESLVLGPQNSVRYAVVSIEGITRGKQLEHEALNVLDNQRCRFVPHVLAASVGQWLVIENSDPILHNADAVSLSDHKTLFNRGLPPNSQSRQPLIHADRLHVTCEVRHTWMEAYVVVADHPYVAVTDAEGAYELRDVPPGKYTLKVWHERLGSLEQVVTVEKGGRHVEDFTFSAPNK
jgi:hypothetical protein